MGFYADNAGYKTGLCVRLSDYLTDKRLWAPGMLVYDREYHCEFRVLNVHVEAGQLYVHEEAAERGPTWRPMSDFMVATDDDPTGGELFGFLGAGWVARLDAKGVDLWDSKSPEPHPVYRGGCLADAAGRALLERG